PTSRDTYTLSLHDALPICRVERLSDEHVPEPLRRRQRGGADGENDVVDQQRPVLQTDRVVEADVAADVLLLEQYLERLSVGELEDRKSTRLNSSHVSISYA